jgi:hypothetical protein
MPRPIANLPRPTPQKPMGFSTRCAANGHITFNLAQPPGIDGHYSNCASARWAVNRPNSVSIDRKKGANLPFTRALTSHTTVVPPFHLWVLSNKVR